MSRLKQLIKRLGLKSIIGVALLLIFGGGLAYLILLICHDNRLSVRDLAVTNVTDSAMTITWISDSKYVGKIYYQKGSGSWSRIFAQAGKEVAYDDRDLELKDNGEYKLKAKQPKRYTHHVTLRDLKPATKYKFRIGGKINGKDGLVKEVYTLPLSEDLKTPNPAYGRVEGLDNNDAFIFFVPKALNGSSPSIISTTISNTGTYNLDLSYYRDEKLEGNDLVAYLKSGKENIAPYQYQKRNYKPLETIKVKLD